jgi:phosphoglycolate phosphatase
MSKLVMLDFDGVIADSLDATCVATIAVLEEHGFAHLASREAVLRLVESNWFEGLRQAGVPRQTADDIDDRVARAVQAALFAPYAAMPGVIARLAERHRLLIVTSNRSDIVEAFLAHWAITGVSEVLGGDKGQSKVPKIRAAVRRFAVAPAARPDATLESWFVGDTVGDMIEGREAGVGTIAVGWGWHSAAQLRGAAPDRYAATPADLLTLLL